MLSTVDRPRTVANSDKPTATDMLSSDLDSWARDISDLRHVNRCVDNMTLRLLDLRQTLPDAEWRRVVDLCRDHPLKGLIHQDPFTGWSCSRPRGYPGDAELLDFIYHHPTKRKACQSATPIGRAIYARNLMVPSCRAVRHRRDLIAAKVDEVCLATHNARILAVAAGHLREADLSDAVATDSLEVLIAVDQDERSLEVVAVENRARRVEARPLSVRQILSGKLREQDFDLIYAAGLYDYLEDRAAARLTRILFEALKPGGRLLIANFNQSVEDAGYMEVFMDWTLILRNEGALLTAIGDVVSEASGVRTFSDDSRTIVYAELTR